MRENEMRDKVGMRCGERERAHSHTCFGVCKCVCVCAHANVRIQEPERGAREDEQS